MNDDGIDFQPATSTNDGIDFQEGNQPKSISGFASNLGSDVMNTGKSIIGAGKSLTNNLIDPANILESAVSGSIQPTKEKLTQDWEGIKSIPGSLMEEGKRIGGDELLKGNIGAAANKLGNAFYEKPVSTAADFAPFLGGPAEEAGNAIEGTMGKMVPIGRRLEANATANAFDLGTYGVRKLAKGDQNPEEVLTNINKKVNELIPGMVNLSDTSASKYQKLFNAKDQAGQVIGQVVDATAAKEGGQIPEVQEAIQSLKTEMSKYNGMTSARNADARAELTDLITRMEGLQKVGKLDFRALQDMKSDIGQAYHNPNLDNHGIDQAYGILNDTMDKILDRTTVDNPEMKTGFDKAKQVYKLTSNLMPAMKRGVSREVAGTGGGLTSAALGAGAIFGHPLAAGAGYLGKTAAKLAAPDFAPNLAYKAINAAKNSSIPGILANTPEGINRALQSYLISKFQKKNAD
jgi:hypothetical protein